MRIALPLLGLGGRGQPYTSTGATTLSKGACYNPRGLPTALAGSLLRRRRFLFPDLSITSTRFVPWSVAGGLA